MNCSCLLSDNTQSYLTQFHRIADDMIEKMSAVTLTQSISASFITQMIPHHQAAIEMSKNLLRYTTDIALQEIALGIISAQEKSIANMLAVKEGCACLENTTQELAAYERKNTCILQTMFAQMLGACSDNNIDANFMREMIPHHLGAVRMSENALCYPLCPALVPLLNAIIASQKKGICQMRRLLDQISCK